MSWLERLLYLTNPSRTEWRLCYDGATLECRTVKTDAGSEIQFFYRGELYHSFVHATRAEAEDEARRKRAELIQRGWTEGTRHPDVARTTPTEPMIP